MVKSKISKGKVALVTGALALPSIIIPAIASAQDNQERPPVELSYPSHRTGYKGQIFNYGVSLSDLTASQLDKDGKVIIAPMYFYDIGKKGFGQEELDAIKSGYQIFMNPAFNDAMVAKIAGEYAKERAKSNADLQRLADLEQKLSEFQRKIPFVSPLNREKAPAMPKATKADAQVQPAITPTQIFNTYMSGTGTPSANEDSQTPTQEQSSNSERKAYPFGISSLFPEGLSQFPWAMIPSTQETSETPKTPQYDKERKNLEMLPGTVLPTSAIKAIQENKMNKDLYWSIITGANTTFMPGDNYFGGVLGARIGNNKAGIGLLANIALGLDKVTDSNIASFPGGITAYGTNTDINRFLIGLAMEGQFGPFVLGIGLDYNAWVRQVVERAVDKNGVELKSNTNLIPSSELLEKIYGRVEIPVANNVKIGAELGANFTNNEIKNPYLGLRAIFGANTPKK
jgi:hypothetical protein